ncbi:MAG: signal recognition particle-docking protein FtsY [Puniceicoccales bacterium]|jgi:fused signal recognition particle receptor|nr:signal recognition particle-docking protein FtsY [Puniceicoccales bacterium]
MLSFFSKFRSGIESVKNKLTSSIKDIFHGKKFDPSKLDELEALLYVADIGVEATQNIIATAKRDCYEKDSKTDLKSLKVVCKDILLDILKGAECSLPSLLSTPKNASDPENPPIILKNAVRHVSCPYDGRTQNLENKSVNGNTYGSGSTYKEDSENHTAKNTFTPFVIGLVGTNGCGKTTTAAKLASFFIKRGKSVLIGACDTFRAAANEQIRSWSQQLHCDLIEGQSGADPASIAFDSCQAAISRQKNVVILDTAGRLPNNANLMSELVKIKKVIGKINPQFPQHLWLVIDAHLGTNGITSALKFHEALGISGIIVTKLDGTSRGGAVVGIYQKLHVPIYFIGTGETDDALVPFVIHDYVCALVGA